MEKRCAQLEKVNHDLKSKVDELISLLEVAQRDFRAKVAELQKLQHDYDKLKDQKDALLRENKKLAGKAAGVLSDKTNSFRPISVNEPNIPTPLH